METRPATMLLVKCSAGPSPHPVSCAVRALTSLYDASWLAVRIDARACDSRMRKKRGWGCLALPETGDMMGPHGLRTVVVLSMEPMIQNCIRVRNQWWQSPAQHGAHRCGHGAAPEAPEAVCSHHLADHSDGSPLQVLLRLQPHLPKHNKSTYGGRTATCSASEAQHAILTVSTMFERCDWSDDR